VVGGQQYYGWISRPIKTQGVVRGFYFWTDAQFTNLTLAEQDGNRDIDQNVTDNSGFVLVVDQNYFDGLIADGLTEVTVEASSVPSAVPAGAYGTIKVRSSSDRVDNALNEVVAAYPDDLNTPLAANNDESNISLDAGVFGGPALEEGADENSPIRTDYFETLNTNTAEGNLVNTIDAIGNVISGGQGADIDLDENTTLNVMKISSPKGTSATFTTSATIAGYYGTLTIYADGNYTYSVDNNHSQVNALGTTSNTLSDLFTYTISDNNGGEASATLTVIIEGSNDAPLAYHDYNTAKEHTSTNDTGYAASGNVLTNDTDVDANDNLRVDLGVSDQSIIIDISSISYTPPTTVLTFEGDLSSPQINGETNYHLVNLDAFYALEIGIAYKF
jgi:VCBS repeat-containing protein